MVVFRNAVELTTQMTDETRTVSEDLQKIIFTGLQKFLKSRYTDEARRFKSLPLPPQILLRASARANLSSLFIIIGKTPKARKDDETNNGLFAHPKEQPAGYLETHCFHSFVNLIKHIYIYNVDDGTSSRSGTGYGLEYVSFTTVASRNMQGTLCISNPISCFLDSFRCQNPATNRSRGPARKYSCRKGGRSHYSNYTGSTVHAKNAFGPHGRNRYDERRKLYFARG